MILASAGRRLLLRTPRCWPLPQVRTVLSETVSARVTEIVDRHNEIMELLNQGDKRPLGKELSPLVPVARLHETIEELSAEEISYKELLEEALSTKDTDLEGDCRQELKRIDESRSVAEKRIIDAILPKDDADGGDAILEVKSGTGGIEAALFAAELLEAYIKTANGQGFKVETLDISKTDTGGVNKASISISGKGGSHGCTDDDYEFQVGSYGFFKYESGVHRVQRVPANDVRIHTSAASVGILPSPTEFEAGNLLPAKELRIDTMRASGAGGQHVNTTESAVRITHLPTGIVVSNQDERSQHKNREKALKVIAARVLEMRRDTEARERGDARSSLMGSGDRSERIRTYNFPQDRVTDHRCKESESGIDRLLGGGVGDSLVVKFAPPLRRMAREELLAALEDKR